MDNDCNCSVVKPSGLTGRRKFLNRLWVLLGGLACFEFGWLTKSILYSQKVGKDTGREDVYITVGDVANFKVNSVTAIPLGQFHLACLVDGSFLALSRTCTHLGCAVPWDENKNVFICPCHGSTFDISGEVLTPPATRGLDSYPLRIENGTIRVNIAIAQKHPGDGQQRSVKV